MEPLDDKCIRTLRRVFKQGTAMAPPFAIVHAETVVVTNGGWLLEWPKHLVDMECLSWARLLAEQEHKKAKQVNKNTKGDWRKQLFKKGGRFIDVEESEPRDAKDTIIVYHDDEYIRYHYTNIEATEACVPDAHFKLYEGPKNNGMHPRGRALVIYEGKHRVGAFMNTLE